MSADLFISLFLLTLNIISGAVIYYLVSLRKQLKRALKDKFADFEINDQTTTVEVGDLKIQLSRLPVGYQISLITNLDGSSAGTLAPGYGPVGTGLANGKFVPPLDLGPSAVLDQSRYFKTTLKINPQNAKNFILCEINHKKKWARRRNIFRSSVSQIKSHIIRTYGPQKAVIMAIFVGHAWTTAVLIIYGVITAFS